MKKQRLFGMVCLLLSACMAFCAYGCDKQDKTARALTDALESYLSSETFTQSVSNVQTTQDRLPLMYLRYINGARYTQENNDAWQTTLRQIDGLIANNALSPDAFEGSAAQTTGFASLPDFLYAWSLCYNQNALYAAYAQTANEFAADIPLIETFLKSEDARLQNGGATQNVAWGYEETNILPLIAANLGIQNATPYCDDAMLSYYEKAEGAFVKATDGGNWNGFTGRPLAASLYRNNEKYDVNYEKTMQGYYPIESDSAYLLQDLVTLDTLADNFKFEITGSYNGVTYPVTLNPQYALLTAVAHGIDMTNYKTADGQEKDVFAVWRKSIQSENGDYKIDNFADMAVTIAYLAKNKNIDAPTPIGAYATNIAVIKL